jgi:hypothetical protein
MKLPLGLALAALACFVLPIAGCANLKAVVNAVGSAHVTAKQAGLAITAFVGAENTATAIVTTCTPANAPGACQSVNLYTVNKALSAGNTVATALQQALTDNPAGPIDGTDYKKLETVITTLDNAINAYNGA